MKNDFKKQAEVPFQVNINIETKRFMYSQLSELCIDLAKYSTTTGRQKKKRMLSTKKFERYALIFKKLGKLP